MPDLKSFYANGSSVVQAPNTKWNTTIHDAFWGPGYWANYTPSANVSTALTLDTHQYYAFGQLGNLPHNTILQSICNMSQLLKQPTNVSGIPPTLVGEWSLETGQAPGTQPDGEDDQTKRTWLRLLFEAQLAAYEPRGPGQASVGWCFWSWKTQYDIDTWSYRLGLQNGWVPANVSDLSQRVFPVLKTGCVDASFNYTAAPDPPPWQGHGSSWNGAASSAGWNGGLEMLAGLVIVGSIFA
jgi:glucan 1,3-beta-glucosidase